MNVTAAVISNQEAMPGVSLMWLRSPEIAAAARPGQFVMARCGDDTLLRRPLSVHQVDGDSFALLYAAVGKGTEWLSRQGAGQPIDALGPLGKGFSVRPGTRNVLLIAGGIGVAPLCFLAETAVRNGRQVRLLYGSTTVDRCALPGGLDEIVATDDGSLGHCGPVTDIIPEHAGWADQVFACGPLPMYRHIVRRREELGLAQKTVQVSLEMRMGCGLGVCYSCTIKTTAGLRQVCTDGPVFDLDEVIWEELDGPRYVNNTSRDRRAVGENTVEKAP